jgi:hypothetical protein
MANFTLYVKDRDFTEAEQAVVNSYMQTQVTAGTTNGVRYTWGIIEQGPEGAKQTVRMWSNIESANGYKDILAAFNPPVNCLAY